MLIIVVLHILRRRFHPKRSMSIMIASFLFTKEILKTIFMILFLLREQNGSREPGKLCVYLFCCKSLKIARNDVGIFYSYWMNSLKVKLGHISIKLKTSLLKVTRHSQFEKIVFSLSQSLTEKEKKDFKIYILSRNNESSFFWIFVIQTNVTLGITL